MSLCIDSRYITGIFALGQWFKVQEDSVGVDSFEFTNWEERSPHDGNLATVPHTNYEMDGMYPRHDTCNGEFPACGIYGPGSRGTWAVVAGHHGISFIDADTKERVSFSLAEVKAFREVRP